MREARDIVERLNLQPHPEGGWYKETWHAAAEPGVRAAGTAIYYLLEADQFSHWHRVDADEVWLWHAGAPLALTLSPDGHDAESRILGPELAQRQSPQIVAPANWWQTATSLGRFTLVSCIVAPGFKFDGFEMAPADWRPVPRDAS